MALGSEVDYRVERFAFSEDLIHERPGLDPTAHEKVVRGVSEILGVLQAASVGEGVEVHPLRPGPLTDHLSQEVAPDKPAAAGNEYPSQSALELLTYIVSNLVRTWTPVTEFRVICLVLVSSVRDTPSYRLLLLRMHHRTAFKHRRR